jgi:hypothetical protein
MRRGTRVAAALLPSWTPTWAARTTSRSPIQRRKRPNYRGRPVAPVPAVTACREAKWSRLR